MTKRTKTKTIKSTMKKELCPVEVGMLRNVKFCSIANCAMSIVDCGLWIVRHAMMQCWRMEACVHWVSCSKLHWVALIMF